MKKIFSSLYRPDSLRFRITALVLIISVIVLVGATAFINNRAIAIIEQNSNERLNTASSTLATTVSVWLEPHLNALQTLVSLPDIISMDAERQKLFLQKMAAAYPYMYLISTTDLKGMNVARNDNEKPKDYSDREWFLKTRDGAAVTFESLIGKTSHRPSLVVAKAIKNEADRIVGVGMFATDLEHLAHQVRVTRAGKTGFAYLIDRKNRVIAHPDPVYANSLCDFSAYPPVKALRQGKRGLVSFVDETGRHWRAYVNKLDNGWGVVVQEQEDELLSTQRLFQRVALTIIFIAVLIMMCTTWWGVMLALKPINALTEAVKRVTPANMSRLNFEFVHSSSLNIRTKDEVGTLADSFYKMAVRLQATLASLEQELNERKGTEEELKKHRDRLGDLVKERTTDLTISNERLKQEIEERKLAEQALMCSEQKYRNLYTNLRDGSAAVRMDGTITEYNAVFQAMLGYAAEEIGKLSYEDITPDKWHAHEAKIIEEQVMTRGYSDIYEKEYRRKDGVAFPVELQTYLLRDENGMPVGMWAFVRDITERKRAEEALKESEERYRLLAKNAHDIIFTMDINLRFTYISPSITRIRGFSVEEAMSQTPAEALTPASLEVAMNAFLEELEIEARETKALWRTRTMILEETCKDGSTIWTETTFSTLRDENNAFTGFLGITRDITDRKQAEEALRKSEERYRFITDNMRDTVWLMDMNFHPVWISPSVVRNRGFTLDELASMPMEKNLTPETMQRVMQIIGDNFTPNKLNDKDHEIILTSELEFYKKDGATLWSDTIVTLLRDADGKPSVLLCVGRDITERKRAEEEKKRLELQLAQAQKMESIGTLAGGIAHDFNNLLTGILGNVSLARMNMDGNNPLCERLKNVEEYVQRGSELTRQLLGFARGGKYEVKPTHLGEFIRRSSEMFGRTKKEIRIHYKAQEGLWTVEVDRGQMEQVLLNLYVNAWQAMQGGGDLYLSVENVELDKMDVNPYDIEPGKFVKMTVTDTGIGMDEATKARVFEPFFTTKELGRGTGLGLASAYGIIKNHGGFINVESEKDLGTSFMIYLPASIMEVDNEYTSKDEVQRGRETILLIDDEEMILDIGAKMLEGLGYEVITATGGRQGLEIYEKNQDRIDLVILDMIMPDFGGKKTFENLRRIDQSLKVLLSSGYSLNSQAEEIMQSGCKGFIQKPFTMVELSKKIRGILDDQIRGRDRLVPVNPGAISN